MNTNWQSRKLSNKIWNLSNTPTKLIPSDIKQHMSEHGNIVDLQGGIPEEYLKATHELYSGLPGTFKKALQDRGLSIQLANQNEPFAKEFLKENEQHKEIPYRNKKYTGAFYTEHQPYLPFVHKFIPENDESIEANIPQFKGHIAHELGHAIDFLVRHLDSLPNKQNKDLLASAVGSRKGFNEARERPIHEERLRGNNSYQNYNNDPILGDSWKRENFADLFKFLLPRLVENKHKPFHENLHSFGQTIWGKKYPWSTKNFLNTLLFLHAALGGEYPGKYFHYDYYKQPYGIKLG